jgi:choline dehydrogenase
MSGFDYIIVGAGSAGCVLASRLTEDASCRVLLLEAGGADDSPLIHTPGTYSLLHDSAFDWAYRTVPQVHLGGRRIFSPRGRVLGGSSSINFMMYVRGNVRDFDRWRDLGNEGWGYEDVLPYFKRSEDNRDIHDQWHGQGGPLTVTSAPEPHALVARYLDSAQRMGLALNPDFNGAEQRGCGRYQRTIKDGARCSAADAFLRPALSRRNLTVATHSFATRVLVGGHKTVTGVDYVQGHQVHRVLAEREVIICGGAFNSPHLLMVSGIGPAKELESLGIKVEHDLPGVGRNLQDHFGVPVGCRLKEPLNFPVLSAQAKDAAMSEYAQTRAGPLAGNFLEVGAFASVGSDLAWPDLQLLLVPAMPNPYPEAGPRSPHGMTLLSYVTRPQSTGRITLASANPLDRPVIDPGYLSDPQDVRISMAGVRLNLQILRGGAFAPILGDDAFPSILADDDEALEAHVRRAGTTIWHVSGTCKMGHDDAAVVDSSLRVRGMNRLRVVDASVMPHVVSANTNASVIMIAEKAADLIRNSPRGPHAASVATASNSQGRIEKFP